MEQQGRPDIVSVGARAMLDRGWAPMTGLLASALAWMEHRHLELLAEEGFRDLRRAHNAVFANLPAGGQRLTELARAAGVTKQAMGELVDDLVARDYLARRPDPHDGRAKLIDWAPRGAAAHEATMRAFAALDEELAGMIGGDQMEQLRDVLLSLVQELGDRHDLEI